MYDEDGWDGYICSPERAENSLESAWLLNPTRPHPQPTPSQPTKPARPGQLPVRSQPDKRTGRETTIRFQYIYYSQNPLYSLAKIIEQANRQEGKQ